MKPMRHAVLAMDGSRQAKAAAAFAGALAWPPASTLAVASVVEAPAPDDLAIANLEGKGFSDWRRVLELSHGAARQQALASIREAVAIVRDRQPAIAIEEIVRVGEPAAELLALARSEAVELMIAGARGRSALERLLLGSVSEALVTEAPCPVLIVREPVADLHTVVAGLHAPHDAERLADVCLRLPLPPATRLVAVTAYAPRPLIAAGPRSVVGGRVEPLLEAWDADEWERAEEAGRRFVGRVRAGAPERVVETRVVRAGLAPSPPEAVPDTALTLIVTAEELGAALIVVGARERHGLAARLGLGSVSRKLVRRASQAVLVVRGAPES